MTQVDWQVAEVTDVVVETPSVHSLTLAVPAWPGHLAGQHAEIRLTAEDGYQAARDYSIASAPEDRELVFTIERLDDGEVSPYLVDIVQPGDRFEVRGPIGYHFIWEVSSGGPLLLVAGGSGVVPFRSMLRHRAAAGSDVPVRLLYSLRSPADLIYAAELEDLATRTGVDITYVYTRAAPPGWDGYARRIDAEILAAVAWPAADEPLAYVCGPTGFVEVAAGFLVGLGHDPARIRTERYGGTDV
jgi:ferredoxin-NADP reductase